MKTREAIGVDVWTAAVQRARATIAAHDRYLVAFSGGKDSMALLEVVIEAARAENRLPVRVDFYDEEAINPYTEAYCERTAARPEVDFRWLAFPMKCNNACSSANPAWYPWAPEDADKWVRPYPRLGRAAPPWIPTAPAAARMALQEIGPSIATERPGETVAAFVAIRAEESPTRFVSIANDRAEHWVIPAGVPGFFYSKPIYDWLVTDVWHAAKRFGWDYNASYDRMFEAGAAPGEFRVGTPFAGEAIQALHSIRTLYPPAMWDALSRRVPGAQTAMLYGSTIAYAKRGMPKKPDGMTYRAFVAALLDRYPPVVRAREAKRVATAIRSHYQRTADPILPNAPHPDTAVSWRLIIAFAFRGDPMGRAVRTYQAKRARWEYPANRAERDRAAARYARELATITDWTEIA